MNIREADLFITGGAGSLGNAIARLRKEQGWTGRLTVFSTDAHKHEKMKREFPDVQFVQGDIRSTDILQNAMVGHDIVIHAAAVKIIPVSEYASIDTFDVNVNGSMSVCHAALKSGIKAVLGISTDKACYPANAYGATKLLMEKAFQEFARAGYDCKFYLIRYGNVLESNGSVIQAWKEAISRGGMISITDPDMTRFWLSPMQAARYVADVFDPYIGMKSGDIFIPGMKGLSVGKLAEYNIGDYSNMVERVPLRPGEKMHECILTDQEKKKAYGLGGRFIILKPSTDPDHPYHLHENAIYSNTVQELNQDELTELLRNE